MNESSTTQKDTTKENNIFPFKFKGNTKEYFKIWFVNVVLSIITLGIYSAWAKVRTRQYFYGNTFLDDTAFQYTANPVKILKGRIIAAIMFAVYFLILHYNPQALLIYIPLFIIIFPWLLVKSLQFNARYTKYRNINFNFMGTYGQAFKYWILMSLLIPFTLYAIIPYLDYRKKKFLINNFRFGRTNFEFDTDYGKFYTVYLVALFGGGFLLFVAILSIVGISIGVGLENQLKTGGNQYLLFLIIYPVILPVLLFIQAYFRVNIFNLVFDNTSISKITFKSLQKTWPVFKIYITNLLGIIFSLGILIPWAQIRIANYRVNCLRVIATDELDSFIRDENKEVSALGEEIGDVFDVDFDFGF